MRLRGPIGAGCQTSDMSRPPGDAVHGDSAEQVREGRRGGSPPSSRPPLRTRRLTGGQVASEPGNVLLAQLWRDQGDDTSSDQVRDVPAECVRQRPGHRDDAVGLIGGDHAPVGVAYLADVPAGQVGFFLASAGVDGEPFLVGAGPGSASSVTVTTGVKAFW